MSIVISVGEGIPKHRLTQQTSREFARQHFSSSFKDIDRLLQVFENGEIKSRFLVKELEWYKQDHSFPQKNNVFIEEAVELGIKAIQNCLHAHSFLQSPIPYDDIDALFFISTTGIATPSIEARILNRLPFSKHVKRIPIWGLGCAGGAAGLARAHEFCRAYPDANVLILSVELCSLTFQKHDHSKSNLIGTSLFGDGAACVLIAGEQSKILTLSTNKTLPRVVGSRSILMKNSLDVMGWELLESGLHVIFSRNIPSIIKKWLGPGVLAFLKSYQLTIEDISHMIAHPGGKKVIDAYVQALQLVNNMLTDTKEVLKEYGNMSSATIFFVLKRFLQKDIPRGEWGLATALGPGFSAELSLLQWK